jgi:phosphoglycerate dehydrogenase-like enzyme
MNTRPSSLNSQRVFSTIAAVEIEIATQRKGDVMMKPITQENSKLGFVGIGYMGRPIARRLLESGFRLTAYDREHSKAEELIQYGGTVAQSVAELSSSCNVVLSRFTEQ